MGESTYGWLFLKRHFPRKSQVLVNFVWKSKVSQFLAGTVAPSVARQGVRGTRALRGPVLRGHGQQASVYPRLPDSQEVYQEFQG